MPPIDEQKTISANYLTRYKGLSLLTGVVLLVWTQSSLLAADSATDQVIIGCSAGANDERTIAECIKLQLEQAEASLLRVESLSLIHI